MVNYLLNRSVLDKIDLKIVHYFIRIKFTYYGRMELVPNNRVSFLSSIFFAGADIYWQLNIS